MTGVDRVVSLLRLCAGIIGPQVLDPGLPQVNKPQLHAGHRAGYKQKDMQLRVCPMIIIRKPFTMLVSFCEESVKIGTKLHKQQNETQGHLRFYHW